MEVDSTATIFSPVKTKRVYDAVYDRIESKILSGELRPGDKLPSEREMMKIFGRSHPTIREALRMLEASGYIRVIPGSCAEVCYTGTDQFEESINELLQMRRVPLVDLCDFMNMTEPEFIKWTAKKRTWEDLLVMEGLLEEMEKAQDDEILYTARMFSYHSHLMKATHNPLLTIFWKCMADFWTEENLARYRGGIVIRDIPKLHQIHVNLLVAIRNFDEKRAHDLIIDCSKNWNYEISKEGGSNNG